MMREEIDKDVAQFSGVPTARGVSKKPTGELKTGSETAELGDQVQNIKL